jgi:hypothetical protein
MKLIRILKPLLSILATGYILMYFSEILFWSRPRPGDGLPGWLGTCLVYSLTGFILLSIIGHFRARSIWALFLAGAVFGWLTEGLVVQTAYEDLPLSLSFTGLAWHALISVLAGWWILRRALQGGLNPALGFSAIIGLGYGLWAINWWLQADGGISPFPTFAVYSLVATLPVMAAYAIVDRLLPEPFIPNRWVILAAVILLGAYFIFVTVPAAGLAAAILPVLLLIVLWTLHRNRSLESEATEDPGTPPPLVNYLGLLAIPAVAIVFYAIATVLDLRWHTNWVLYVITTPAGFVMFILSMWKIWRRKPAFSS